MNLECGALHGGGGRWWHRGRHAPRDARGRASRSGSGNDVHRRGAHIGQRQQIRVGVGYLLHFGAGPLSPHHKLVVPRVVDGDGLCGAQGNKETGNQGFGGRHWAVYRAPLVNCQVVELWHQLPQILIVVAGPGLIGLLELGAGRVVSSVVVGSVEEGGRRPG